MLQAATEGEMLETREMVVDTEVSLQSSSSHIKYICSYCNDNGSLISLFSYLIIAVIFVVAIGLAAPSCQPCMFVYVFVIGNKALTHVSCCSLSLPSLID